MCQKKPSHWYQLGSVLHSPREKVMYIFCYRWCTTSHTGPGLLVPSIILCMPRLWYQNFQQETHLLCFEWLATGLFFNRLWLAVLVFKKKKAEGDSCSVLQNTSRPSLYESLRRQKKSCTNKEYVPNKLKRIFNLRQRVESCYIQKRFMYEPTVY